MDIFDSRKGKVRTPAVAGAFYDGDSEQLKRAIIECFLKGPGNLPSEVEGKREIIAGVVSDAGMWYCGPVSAYFYKELREDGIPDSFIIIGSNKQGIGEPFALSPHSAWETPLGLAQVDRELSEAIISEGDIVAMDERAHKYEHAIEVQLPYLQYLYNKINFVPIIVANQDLEHSTDLGKAIAAAIMSVGKDVVIIAVSTGNHYEAFESTRIKDREAVEAVVKMEERKFLDTIYEKNLTWNGYGPIVTAIVASKELYQCDCRLLEYSTSYEVALDRDSRMDGSSVVSYLAFSIKRKRRDTDVINIGSVIEHYKILNKIGQGGMGTVYLAKDTILGSNVIVKVMNIDCIRNKSVNRFIREARAQVKLRENPNVVNIYEIGTKNVTPFIIMEYIDGGNLRDLLINKGKLRIHEAIEIFIQICNGLCDAHKCGIIHRDLKPENILMKKDGRIKISDFGLAKLESEPSLTLNGEVMGTVHYMSPEQIRGDKVDKRSDIYSLGIILYEMLTGRVPFTNDNMATILFKHLYEEPESPKIYNPNTSDEIERVIFKALRKNPNERFQTVEEMVSILKVEEKRIQ